MSLVIALIMAALTAGTALTVKARNARVQMEVDEYNESRSYGLLEYRPWPTRLWLAPAALCVVALAFSLIYAQDPGESVVLRNWGGSLAGHSEEAGFHAKAPWQSTVKYDVCNNILSFIGNGVACMDYETAWDMANLYGVSLDELIGRKFAPDGEVA